MKIGSALGFLVWGSVLGLLGWFFYSMQESARENRELREQIARLSEETRVARFYVRDAVTDAGTGRKTTSLRWQELGPDGGRGLPVREITVSGDRLWFEAQQIVFDPRLVREGDPLRGKAISLFRRVVGREEGPEGRERIVDQAVLEVPREVASGDDAPPPGDDVDVPPYFRSEPRSRPGELEGRLWADFWHLCTDRGYAAAEGVRTSQDIAVSKPLVVGKEYELTLTSQGALLLEGPFDPDPLHVPEEEH